MKAVVLYGPHKVAVGDLPVAPLGAGDIKVKVAYCGICGSDIPRVFGGTSYYYPIVLGHEFAGIVKDSKYRLEAIKKVIDCAKENELKCVAFMKSPISGGDGNIEYLVHFIVKKE